MTRAHRRPPRRQFVSPEPRRPPCHRRDTSAFMTATVCETMASTPNIPSFALALDGSP